MALLSHMLSLEIYHHSDLLEVVQVFISNFELFKQFNVYLSSDSDNDRGLRQWGNTTTEREEERRRIFNGIDYDLTYNTMYFYSYILLNYFNKLYIILWLADSSRPTCVR